jgi:hypothetical protein
MTRFQAHYSKRCLQRGARLPSVTSFLPRSYPSSVFLCHFRIPSMPAFYPLLPKDPGKAKKSQSFQTIFSSLSLRPYLISRASRRDLSCPSMDKRFEKAKLRQASVGFYLLAGPGQPSSPPKPPLLSKGLLKGKSDDASKIFFDCAPPERSAQRRVISVLTSGNASGSLAFQKRQTHEANRGPRRTLDQLVSIRRWNYSFSAPP